MLVFLSLLCIFQLGGTAPAPVNPAASGGIGDLFSLSGAVGGTGLVHPNAVSIAKNQASSYRKLR